MSAKLFPCPFCGVQAAVYCETSVWWVRCENCQAESGSTDTEEGAAEIWNTRSKPVAGVEVKPFLFGVREADGSPYFEEMCVSAHPEELEDAAHDIGGEVVALYTSPQPDAVITEEMVERAAQWMALDHVSISDRAEYSWDATDDLWKAAWRKKARAALTAALKEA